MNAIWLLAVLTCLQAPTPDLEDAVLAQHARLDQQAFDELLGKWDRNHDLVLTKAELGPDRLEHLRYFDANQDDRLDAAEFIQQRQKERSALGAPMPIAEVKDQSYGPHARNVFDLWLAPGDEPTPLVIYIHGGGFRNGDKEFVRYRERENVARCFRSGVSFAAINYRLIEHATIDQIMDDGALAVQYLRLHAEQYNLDPALFAAYGHSAGGGIALWLGTVDDLAAPLADDVVRTQSSRLVSAGHIAAQASYDFDRWAEIFKLPMAFIRMGASSFRDYYCAEENEQLDSDSARKIRDAVDMPAFLDKHDAHLHIENLMPLAPPASIGDMIHHPLHATWLKQLCDERELPATLTIATTPVSERVSVIDFFLERFAELQTDAAQAAAGTK